MSRRVVVTGMGAITPIGLTVNEFWENAKKGTNGITKIEHFDTTDFKVKLAGEVKNFVPENYIDKREARRMDRFCQLAMAASKEAVEDSGLDLENINRDRLGVIVGSGIGGLGTIEQEHTKYGLKGPSRVSPMLIPTIIVNIVAGNIAIKYGAKAMCYSVVTACATGTNSIGEAFTHILNNKADVIIAGGTEAAITPLSIAGFTSLTALSTTQDPDRASIPFDAERNGFVMGEGSGILILEELEHAKARGAKIYAEVVGYGNTCDAYHVTSPDPNGEGAARAMIEAITQANIEKEEISYINAHGTSTPYNDKFETAAIKKVFGESAKNVPMSSTKSMIGHLLGAAGAVESIICIKSCIEDYMPPTINYKVKDEDCDLDCIPNEGRNGTVNYALTNSLGFGGHNATLIFKKWSE